MKIAAAAYPIDWLNRWNDYVGKLRVWVRTAAEQGAELLVFPEYGALELASLAEEKNAADLGKLVDVVNARIKDVDELHGSLAREFKVHIAAATGPVKGDDLRPVNRARLVAPDGSQGFQDKLMPTRFEREEWGLTAGKVARVFDTALGRIGILIGYDAEFPLIARAMAEAGAEILLVPGCSDDARSHARVRTGAMARALENQCVVVHATTVGTADWLPLAKRNVGAAALYGPAELGFPEDGVIAAGKPDTAGWVYGEAILDDARKARAGGKVLNFRDWEEQAGRVAEVETVTLGLREEPEGGEETGREMGE